MKTIITFGSSHLKWLHHKLNPMKVALIIEADNENLARQKVFESRIGEYFATSYPYELYMQDFKKRGWIEYSLIELEAVIIKHEDLKWETVDDGLMMASCREYFIYYNPYDDDYSIHYKVNVRPIFQKITKNEMIDFLNGGEIK